MADPAMTGHCQGVIEATGSSKASGDAVCVVLRALLALAAYRGQDFVRQLKHDLADKLWHLKATAAAARASGQRFNVNTAVQQLLLEASEAIMAGSSGLDAPQLAEAAAVAVQRAIADAAAVHETPQVAGQSAAQGLAAPALVDDLDIQCSSHGCNAGIDSMPVE